MEEVSLDTHGPGLVIVNGQTVILPRNSRFNNISDLNVDSVNHSLSEVNTHNGTKDVGNLQESLSNCGLNGLFPENGFLIVSDQQRDNNTKMIQLSVQQASELGLEFSTLDSTNPKEVKQEGNAQDVLGQQYLFEDAIEQVNSVNELNTNNIDSHDTMDLNNFSDLLQLPTLGDNLDQQVTLIPQCINGQLTYTLQIPEGINNTFEYAQISQVTSNTNNTISPAPITNQQPVTIQSRGDKIGSSNVLKCIASLPTRTEQNTEKINSMVVSRSTLTPVGTSSFTTASLVKDQLTYVIPSKPAQPNPKRRILACSKVLQRNILAKPAEQTKILQPKVQSVNTKGQSLLINSQRKIAPMKMPLPALNPINNRRDIVVTKQKLPANKMVSLTTSSVGSTQNNVINRKVVNVAAKTGLTNKRVGSSTSDNLRVSSASGAEQNISEKQDDIEILEPTQLSNTLKTDKIVNSSGQNLNGSKPMRRLTPSQLKQIASVLQKNRNNHTGLSSPSTLYDTETNTRIICRVVYPEDFVNRVDKRVTLTKKRGRSAKFKETNETSNTKKPVVIEERKKQALSRTRSGRLSRPPRHMVKDYKRLQGDDSEGAYSDYVSEAEENSGTPEIKNPQNLLPGLSLRQKRNISSEFRCPTCNKIYLGHVRMRWHFTKYPDHGNEKHLQALADGNSVGRNNGKGTSICRRGIGWGRGRGRVKRLHPVTMNEMVNSCPESEVVEAAGETVAKVLSVWEMILLRLDAVKGDKTRVATLCEELNSLVQKIRVVSDQLFKPKMDDGSIDDVLNLEDETLCNILGIPKGTYTTNDTALEAIKVELKEKRKFKDVIAQEALDMNVCKKSKLDEDDSIVSKEDSNESKCDTSFLLSSEMLCDKTFQSSDKSSLESVDQIVSERLRTLAPVDDLMTTLSALPDAPRSLDSSDDLMAGLLTSVESMSTQSLTDSIIFTPPNESRLVGRNHVSASTEDLMKSLENLSREINESHVETLPSTDLDFTVLSQDFSTGSLTWLGDPRVQKCD